MNEPVTHEKLKVQSYLDMLHRMHDVPVRGARSRRRKKRAVQSMLVAHKEAWEAKGPDPTKDFFEAGRRIKDEP